MEKIFRRLLLFTSAVVFMALAPLVVFYAMGYRIGIDAKSDLSVGVLLVETTPRRSQVTVDDRDAGTTPTSVPNLPPGEVTVKLTKEGYESWEKRLMIEPTEVTDLRGVRLFPVQRSPRALLADVSTFSLSPNRQLIAAIAGGKLHVIDEEGTSLFSALAITEHPRQLLWSPDSNSLLLIGERTTALVAISGSTKAQPLPVLYRALEIAWDPRIPGRILAITPQGDLTAYQTGANISTTIATNIQTFATSSRNVFVNPQAEANIHVLTLQGQHLRTIPFTAAVRRLVATPSGVIGVWDEQGRLSTITDQEIITPVAESAERAGFSPDGQLLYVQTDNTSLHVLNMSDQRLRHLPLEKLVLATRLTSSIRDPQWFAGGHHLMYQIEDEIVISEIDTRDHPISYTVDSTNLGKSEAAVGRDGERIFYLKDSGAGVDLVVMPLIVE